MTAGDVESGQIEQREEEDPDDIDEVPVKTADLDGRIVFFGERSLPGQVNESDQNSRADDHVQRVEPRHGEIDPEEDPHVLVILLRRMIRRRVPESNGREKMMIELLLVFEKFDDKESEAQEQSHRQEGHEFFTIAHLGIVNSERHRQAAQDQNEGVQTAQGDAQQVASLEESVRILVPEDCISQEQASKEHQFRQQEDPHANGAGLFLLLHTDEMMRQSGDVSCVFCQGNSP